MYCTRKVTDDLIWVGADDRRLACFEGVYGVPDGVSYNSYVMLDEKTAIFDTVDKAVYQTYFENVAHALGGRRPDYLVISHMEPDHAYTIEALLLRYPELKLVCNSKIETMLKNFFRGVDFTDRLHIVKEGDVLSVGAHELTFYLAPMIHWPEVMMTYDKSAHTLFTADAFGVFGALNGAIFADEVDFDRDYLKEARRYYTNIVGKYGVQVQNLFKKIAGLDIQMLCPLHGFVWRRDLGYILEKYNLWSTYTPEDKGVMIAYASIYGNTENAAEILASKLRERGVRTAMYDVSVTPASDIIAECFRWSHLVFASATYNGGIFVTMDELLRDIAAHNLQKRTVAFMENGTWAPVSARQMAAILAPLKNMTVLEQSVAIRSSLTEGQLAEIEALADVIAEGIR